MSEKTGLNILSCFDGMSCGQIALNRLGIKVDKYYASEIGKNAMRVTQQNYPDTIQLGDIKEWQTWDIDKPDLIMAGSPCQGFSFAGKRLNFNDSRSKLFFNFVNILKRYNPKYFLLENVKMEKKFQDVISDMVGVHPIEINSNLVSFQNRSRLYWSNISGIETPKNKEVSFQDNKSKDSKYLERFAVNKTPSRIIMWGNGVNGKCPNVTNREKVNCLTLKQDRWSNSGLVKYKDFCRYLTTEELEKAQTIPVGYCECLTKAQAEKVIGNGWTIDVICHILKNLPFKEKE